MKIWPYYEPYHPGPQEDTELTAWMGMPDPHIKIGWDGDSIDILGRQSLTAIKRAKIDYRHYTMTEPERTRLASEKPADVGRDHGRRYLKIIRDASSKWGIPLSQFSVETINEPLWYGSEDWAHMVPYTLGFLEVTVPAGLSAAVIQASVGQPPDRGVKDSLENWDPAKPILDLFPQANTDPKHPLIYIARHEYCYVTGPRDGWGWYMGRYTQGPHLPTLVTEIGIERLVASAGNNMGWPVETEHGGWQSLGFPSTEAKAKFYVNDVLAPYNDQIELYPWIEAAFIFLYDCS